MVLREKDVRRRPLCAFVDLGIFGWLISIFFFFFAILTRFEENNEVS